MSEQKSNDKPLAEMTRDELRKLAAELKIAGRGTMLKPALIEAIALERAARIERAVTATLRGSDSGEPRGIVNIEPKTTSANVSPEELETQLHAYASYPNLKGTSGQGVPMTDGKRRLNYYAQNGHAARFTPKQRRRYAKKAAANLKRTLVGA